MRARDQVEMEYRQVYREQFQNLVEEGDWVDRNAPATYAGYEISSREGGIIYVGFTAEQDEMLERLKRRLIAPERFRPFPTPPRYTEDGLEEIAGEFLTWKGPLRKLVTGVSIDYLANKVIVGTEHVARVKELITQRYGPDAPFKVVFELPGVLL